MATPSGDLLVQICCSVILLTVLTGVVDSTNTTATNDVTVTATPNTIYTGLTKVLTINCSFNTGPGSDFSDVMSLIMSRTTSSGPAGFHEVATLTKKDKGKVEVKDGSTGAVMAGHIPDNGTAFLSLKWTYPDDTVQGEYQCEAFGMDHSGHPRVSKATTELVAEADVTTAILVAELRAMHKAQDDFDEFKTNMTSRLDGAMAAIFATSSSFGGHNYYLSKPTLRDITKSDALCRLFGGYLVEIGSQTEYDFVWDFVVVRNSVQFLTLGATDMDKEGVWTFLHSGTPVVFQKHGDGLTGGATNNCMEIWKEYNGYVDEPCFGANHRNHVEGTFLCEMNQ